MNGVNGWRGISGWRRMCVFAEVSASLERLSYVLYVTGLYVFERDRETVVINSWEVIRLLIKNTIAFKSCCIHIIGLPCVRLDSPVSEST